MSPKGWVRYWKAGVILGPVLAIVMAVRGEWAAVIVAIVITAWSVRMVAVWRARIDDGEAPPGS